MADSSDFTRDVDESLPLKPRSSSLLQPNIDHTYEVEQSHIELSESHEKLTQETENLMTKVLYISFSFGLTYSMRSNILVLYARTFYDNTAIISLVIYLSYVTSSIASLSFGIIGDKWRFDYLLIIAGVADVITFWMEAATQTFVVLAVAFALGGQPFSAIVQSWNIKLTPTYYAQQFKGRFLQFFTIGYICGPLVGGILAYIFSYRLVFYVSAIMAVILLLFSIKFFWNIEEKIVQKQLNMKQHYNEPIKPLNNNLNNELNNININNDDNINNIDESKVQLMLIELIPKNMGGKITGTKLFIRMISKGTVCLLIGVLWSTSIEFFWYVPAICHFICLCLIGGVAVLETKKLYNL